MPKRPPLPKLSINPQSSTTSAPERKRPDRETLEREAYQKVEELTAKSEDPLAKEIFSYDTGIEEIWVHQQDKAPKEWWIAAATYPSTNLDTIWGSFERSREETLESLKQKIKEKEPSTRSNVKTSAGEGARAEPAQRK